MCLAFAIKVPLSTGCAYHSCSPHLVAEEVVQLRTLVLVDTSVVLYRFALPARFTLECEQH